MLSFLLYSFKNVLCAKILERMIKQQRPLSILVWTAPSL